MMTITGRRTPRLAACVFLVAYGASGLALAQALTYKNLLLRTQAPGD